MAHRNIQRVASGTSWRTTSLRLRDRPKCASISGGLPTCVRVLISGRDSHPSRKDLVAGDRKLSSVTVRNTDSGETEESHPGAVFVFIGLDPNTGFLKGTINLDDGGFIKTSGPLERNVKGVFAAGDVRAGSTKQVVSAAGEGAAAALMARQYLEATEGSRGYKGDS